MALGTLYFPELALSAYLPTDPGAGHSYYRAFLDDWPGPTSTSSRTPSAPLSSESCPWSWPYSRSAGSTAPR